MGQPAQQAALIEDVKRINGRYIFNGCVSRMHQHKRVI
jgi:hypothetical protein